jgi:hypothetical protein
MDNIERRVIGKVMRRLIPFLILCYFVAYLDRVNVGFAKLHMNQALGFSEAAFGLGAGLFFIAYFLFEVPSNIFLERVGARVWIARIMHRSWNNPSEGANPVITSVSAPNSPKRQPRYPIKPSNIQGMSNGSPFGSSTSWAVQPHFAKLTQLAAWVLIAIKV